MKAYIVPDVQCRADAPNDHVDWIASDIVRRKPDLIVVLGDWWDLPSLSTHSEPGSASMEGARVEDDIRAGNEAFARLAGPVQAEIDRLARNHRARWTPKRVFLFGNHEHRLARAVERDPKWAGIIGEHHMLTPGFERYPFLARFWDNGICYSHFFQSSHSSHAIGGSIDNRLNKLKCSFTMGHQQTLLYGLQHCVGGRVIQGLVAGAFYQHDEDYAGPQGNDHWRGIVVKNEVYRGRYDPCFVSLDYLRRNYL